MKIEEVVKEKEKIEKLPIRAKLGYGSFEMAGSLSLVAFLSFGMYFLTDVAGLNPAVAGTLLAIGSVVNAVAAPVIGAISDGCKSKYGRRRPFLLVSALPFGIILWLVFSDFGFGDNEKIVYFAVVIPLYYIFMALMDVPFTSLGAEMTKDYDERTSLNTFRSVFCQLASIISGSLIISIAALLGDKLGSQDAGWSVMAAILGIVCTLIIINGWRATKGYERHREESDKVHIKDFAHAFKNKTFVYMACIYSSGIGAYTIGQAVNVYFLANYMHLDAGKITIVLAIYNISAIAWLPLIPFISKRYSKRAAWVVMMGIWAISLLMTFFLVRPEKLWMLYVTL